MKKRRLLSILLWVLVVGGSSIGVTQCASQQASVPANVTLLVSAAASLQDPLTAIEPLFEEANPTLNITYNFGASGALQRQIEQGAPVDIFLSAAQKQMDLLQQKGLLRNESRRDLLTNRLVLIVPTPSGLNLTNFQQLADTKVQKIAVGEFRSVPAGQYAEEVFKNLGILAAVKPKLVFGNSVRTVLSGVVSGNVDAGVVYGTDAQLSGQVKVVATADTALHAPIVYPVAILKASQQMQAANAYIQFLSEAASQDIFKKYGFGTL